MAIQIEDIKFIINSSRDLNDAATKLKSVLEKKQKEIAYYELALFIVNDIRSKETYFATPKIDEMKEEIKWYKFDPKNRSTWPTFCKPVIATSDNVLECSKPDESILMLRETIKDPVWVSSDGFARAVLWLAPIPLDEIKFWREKNE